MYIPDYVQFCIDRLESAGYAAYIVGGCVRDACLGLTPSDYDMCTSAMPEQTQALFCDHKLVLSGLKHGTVAVITDDGIVEITTFRTEGGYSDSRHPEWVRFVADIESDLARRDFTVNAMAYSPSRGFADPFGGRQDLEKGILRAVGDAAARFEEDALRILRGARFAAKYRLQVEQTTLDAMLRLRDRMDNLARERVFDELCKLLLAADAAYLLTFSPILAAVIPELAPMIGFDQRSPHHAYDLFTHTACVAAATPAQLTLRWAGLLHDTGKIPTFTLDDTGRGHFYSHARFSAEIAGTVLRRLKAPNALREDVVQLIQLHMNRFEPDKKILRRWLSKLGPVVMDNLLSLQQADMGSKGTPVRQEMAQFPQLRSLIDEILAESACFALKDLAINGNDLIALGYEGKAIGSCLRKLLNLVIDEQLPNKRDALLHAAATLTKQ